MTYVNIPIPVPKSHLLTGDFISAEEGMNLRLLSRLVDRDLLLDTAMELARKINSKNPMGLRLTKKAINMNLDAGSLEQALNLEDRNQTLLMARERADKGEKASRYF